MRIRALPAALLCILTLTSLASTANAKTPADNPPLQFVGSHPTPGLAIDVHVVGDLAFVADRDEGLQIFDVTNKWAPTLLTTFDTPGLAFGVFAVDTLVYVADYSGGVRVINVADPYTPSEVGHFDTTGEADALVVSGDYAYVAYGNGGLQVLNVSDPTAPVSVGSLPLPEYANAIDLVDTLVYTGQTHAGMYVISVARPDSPYVVGFVDTPERAVGVVKSGDYVFVGDTEGGMQVVDVATPAIPALVAGLPTSGDARGVSTYGSVVYLADGGAGLKVVDVSTPDNPVLADSIFTGSEAYGLHVDGNYLYVANYADLQIYQIDPADITLNAGTEDLNHVLDHSPEIGWTHADTTFSQVAYDVEVGTDGDWSVAELWATGEVTSASTTVQYAGGTLEDGSTYYLRLRLSDSTGWGGWTEMAFHMNSLPSVPTPASPLSFAEVNSNLPTLAATVGPDAESDSQKVQFGIYMDDTILVQESALLPAVPAFEGDTVIWTASAPLTENWYYFWSVRAWDGHEITPQLGTIEFFAVNAVQEPPDTTLLLIPLDDSIVYTQHPHFVWLTASDPDPYDTVSYQFEIALNSIFSGALEIPGLSDTAYVLFTELELGTDYWWRVLSQDNHDLEVTSLGWHLRVYIPGDLNNSRDVTAADVIAIVNYVYRGGQLDVPECVADVNGNGEVTAADIITLVNYIFKGGPQPPGNCG